MVVIRRMAWAHQGLSVELADWRWPSGSAPRSSPEWGWRGPTTTRARTRAPRPLASTRAARPRRKTAVAPRGRRFRPARIARSSEGNSAQATKVDNTVRATTFTGVAPSATASKGSTTQSVTPVVQPVTTAVRRPDVRGQRAPAGRLPGRVGVGGLRATGSLEYRKHNYPVGVDHHVGEPVGEQCDHHHPDGHLGERRPDGLGQRGVRFVRVTADLHGDQRAERGRQGQPQPRRVRYRTLCLQAISATCRTPPRWPPPGRLSSSRSG